MGMGVQWLSDWMGMTQYQHGYKFEYNLVVFLIVQTITGMVYVYLKKNRACKL